MGHQEKGTHSYYISPWFFLSQYSFLSCHDEIYVWGIYIYEETRKGKQKIETQLIGHFNPIWNYHCYPSKRFIYHAHNKCKCLLQSIKREGRLNRKEACWQRPFQKPTPKDSLFHLPQCTVTIRSTATDIWDGTEESWVPKECLKTFEEPEKGWWLMDGTRTETEEDAQSSGESRKERMMNYRKEESREIGQC